MGLIACRITRNATGRYECLKNVVKWQFPLGNS